MIIKILNRYKFALLILIVLVIITIFLPSSGVKAFSLAYNNIIEMLEIVPPVFILLGLMDVWVSRERMMSLMGDGSGLIGIFLAFFIGSMAAGPLYAAFPIAGTLIKKGVSFFNIMIFIGAWATTKIPMLLIEISSLGLRFAITRFICDIIGINIIAYIVTKLVDTTTLPKLID